MPTGEKPISFHIIERNNKNFLIWTYPTISPELRKYLIETTFTFQNKFVCLRRVDVWIYISHVSEQFALIVLSNHFHPTNYKILCEILGRKYLESRNPVELVKLYLILFSSNQIEDNGRLLNLNNAVTTVSLKDFIGSFGFDIILLYTSILLKRRVILYNENLDLLINELEAAGNLVPSRNVNDYLYPLVRIPREIKGLSFFVAGTNNANLKNEPDLYDLFIDMPTREIVISPKSEEILTMTKTHKDIAKTLVKLSESDLNDCQIKEGITNKTNDLLSLLNNLGSVPTISNKVKLITMNDLKGKNYHPAVENFLFHLAIAENIMML